MYHQVKIVAGFVQNAKIIKRRGMTSFINMLIFKLFFNQLNALKTFSLSKIVSLHTFVLPLFTSLRVVAARLLILAKH